MVHPMNIVKSTRINLIMVQTYVRMGLFLCKIYDYSFHYSATLSAITPKLKSTSNIMISPYSVDSGDIIMIHSDISFTSN
jgi:hypothetical protein